MFLTFGSKHCGLYNKVVVLKGVIIRWVSLYYRILEASKSVKWSLTKLFNTVFEAEANWLFMKWLQKKGGCFQEVVAMRELTVPSCVLGIAGSVITTGLYSHLENQFDDSEQD